MSSDDNLIKKINEKLDEIKTSLDDPKNGLSRINARLDATFEQTVKLTEDMDEVQETQATHTKILKTITTSLDRQNENTGKLNRRVSTLEDNAGIVSPPELTLTD